MVAEDLTLDHDSRTITGWIEMTAEGWHVRIQFDADRLSGFGVTAPTEAVPLTAKTAQRLPLGLFERRARAMAARLFEHIETTLGNAAMQQASALWADKYSGQLTERGLAVLTAAYVDLCATSAHPARDLAERLGVETAQIHERLRAAKRRGLFDKSAVPPGKAGGALTDRARQVLEAMEDQP